MMQRRHGAWHQYDSLDTDQPRREVFARTCIRVDAEFFGFLVSAGRNLLGVDKGDSVHATVCRRWSRFPWAMAATLTIAACSTAPVEQGSGPSDDGGSSTDPRFSVSLRRASVSVVSGGDSTTTAVRISRSNLTTPIGLAASEIPPGITVGFLPDQVFGDSSVVFVRAANGAAAGTYKVVVDAVAPALTARSAELTITVSAPPAGTASFDMSTCFDPAGWMAVQPSTAAAWTRVTGQRGRYRFNATGTRVGIAYSANVDGSVRHTNVVYGSAEEIANLPLGQLCEERPADFDDGKKVFAVGAPDNTTVTFGGYTQDITATNVARRMYAPRSGTHDLVAWRAIEDSLRIDRTSARVIVRRAVDASALVEDGNLVPTLDPSTQEAVPLPWEKLRVESPGGFGSFGFAPFVTAGRQCFPVPMPTRPRGGVSVHSVAFNAARFDQFFGKPYRSLNSYALGDFVPGFAFIGDRSTPFGDFEYGYLPDVVRRPGELVGAVVFWGDRVGNTGYIDEQRVLIETFGAPPTQIVAPSTMPVERPASVSGAGYQRLRFRFELPPDVDDAAIVRHEGNDGNIFSVRATRSFLAGRAVDITMPDFAGVDGWQDVFGPHGGGLFEIRGEKDTRPNRCSIGRTAWSARVGVL